MDGCIFCKIINGQLPSRVVYEDDKVFAFNDINPMAPVHVLVVPKMHVESVKDITDENVNILGDIHLAANKIAQKLGIYDKGYRLVTNCGGDAGQVVFHLHYHLMGGKRLGSKLEEN